MRFLLICTLICFIGGVTQADVKYRDRIHSQKSPQVVCNPDDYDSLRFRLDAKKWCSEEKDEYIENNRRNYPRANTIGSLGRGIIRRQSQSNAYIEGCHTGAGIRDDNFNGKYFNSFLHGKSAGIVYRNGYCHTIEREERQRRQDIKLERESAYSQFDEPGDLILPLIVSDHFNYFLTPSPLEILKILQPVLGGIDSNSLNDLYVENIDLDQFYDQFLHSKYSLGFYNSMGVDSDDFFSPLFKVIANNQVIRVGAVRDYRVISQENTHGFTIFQLTINQKHIFRHVNVTLHPYKKTEFYNDFTDHITVTITPPDTERAEQIKELLSNAISNGQIQNISATDLNTLLND